MKNPPRRKKYYFIATCTALPLVLLGFVLCLYDLRSPWTYLFWLLCLPAGLYCWCPYADAERHAWQYRRLKAGRDVIARWQVDHQTWRNFLEDEIRYNQTHTSEKYANWLHLFSKPHPQDQYDDIEIIASQYALIVNDDFQPLPAFDVSLDLDEISLTEQAPKLLKINLTRATKGRYGSRIISQGCLRVVVPEDAVAQAQLVVAQLQSTAEQGSEVDHRLPSLPFTLRSLGVMSLYLLSFVTALVMFTFFDASSQNTLLVSVVTGVYASVSAGLLVGVMVCQRFCTKAIVASLAESEDGKPQG